MDQDEVKREQLRYIKQLPVRTVNVGEKRESIACDFTKKIAYFLDANGNPIGKAILLDDEKISQLQSPGGEREREKKNGAPQNEGSNNESVPRSSFFTSLKRLAGASEKELNTPSPSKKESSNRKNRQKKILFGVVILAIIAGLTVYYYLDISTQSPETEASTGVPSLSEIDVIQVTEELIPGDQISSENIQQVSISAEVYNQISLSSVNLYQWSRSDSLIDAYAVKYIPRGQYLTYENVNSVYEPKTNPWSDVGEGYTLLTLPLEDTDADINYGSILSLTIEKKTVQETGSRDPDEETPVVEGLEHKTSVEQSSIVDTYGLSDVVVCDLLNSDENSIYNTLTSWMAIPAGEQEAYIKSRLEEDEDLGRRLQTEYVRIRVTDAQAKALGSLTEGDVSVKITVQEKSDTGSDAKRQYASEARALMKTIQSLIEDLDAGAEEEN